MPRFGRIFCLAALAATSSGCALPYYWQAIGGQLDLLRKREAIEAIVGDADRDAELRTALRAAAELRRFAVTDLHLPDNDSYTTYTDLGRPYVVWNVVATEPYSVDPQQWCFPFAGCVNYRGYFEREDAEAFQRRLARRGFDTYSAGSTAYSTLGYFADPVLNTMLHRGVEDVAAILFHELAHQKVYVPGDSELSEAFATAVEEHGVEMWLRARGDRAGLERYANRVARRGEIAALVAAQQSRLRAVFAADSDEAAKRTAKASAFEQMRTEYASLKERWGGIQEYDAWFAGPLNNATLVAITTYRRWLPALKSHLRQVGFEQYYSDVAALADLPAHDRQLRLEEWETRALAAGGLPQL
jgi:predicted aminopeptidase